MRSTDKRPVALSSSYLTFEPLGISMTARKPFSIASPSSTSCQACMRPTAPTGHQAAGVADRRLLPVLVLDPDLHDHARGAVIGLLVLDNPVHREAVAGVDGLDERHRHRATPGEAGAEQPDHQLRHVGGRHHSLGQAGAEPLLARPRLVAVDGARFYAGVDIDPAL